MINKKDFLLVFLALLTSISSLVMVVSNAVTRGVTLTEQMILSLLALVFCMGTQFLPAMSKRLTGWVKLVAWLIWVPCLIITMYNQLSFFTNVSTVAGEYRAKNSVQLSHLNQQIESVKQALSRISARPVAVVARDLSYSKNEKRIAALNVELEEAQRAIKLQDDLITHQRNVVTMQRVGSIDPVISLLESVTHGNAAVISITKGAASALVLELLAAFLWYILRPMTKSEVIPKISVSSVLTEPEVIVSSDDEKLAIVKHAVDTKEIKPTVVSIRKLLNCSMDKAMAIRKAFLARQNHSPGAMGEEKLDYI